jgi:hypothetical protein
MSNETIGREVPSEQLQLASHLFTKIFLHGMAVRRLLPDIPAPDPMPGVQIWDLPSIAILTRTIIDNYLMFFYLAVQSISTEEADFRILVWKYHGEHRRVQMLDLIESKNPLAEQVRRDHDSLKSNIVSHPMFQTLGPEVKKRISSGNEPSIRNNAQISGDAGISEAYHRATYHRLSSYVHSHSFALSQMGSVRGISEDLINSLSLNLNH